MITKINKATANLYVKSQPPNEIFMDEENFKQYFWHFSSGVTIEYSLVKDAEANIHKEDWFFIDKKPIPSYVE